MKPEFPEADTMPGAADEGGSVLSLYSHDLRSALFDITGGLGLIDPSPLPPEQRSQFERVRAAGEALARLLDHTLSELDRPDGDRITTASRIELARFIDEIGRRWGGRADQLGVRFAIHRDPQLPAVVSLDAIALERILANMLSNAMKYAEGGSVTLSVLLGEERELIFRVHDSGPGFSPAALARLFRRNGRTEESKAGSGLGLYIARELAGLMGGEMRAENHPEGGAVTELALPFESWFSREGAARAAGSEEAPDLSHLRILLAEDNATNQLVASQMLAAMGAQCDVASDGVEALERLEREDYDLALVDIEMPRMSGLDLMRAVRGRADDKADMPLVALTAYVMREHRERIFAAGATGIIAKPLASIAELGRAVIENLERARSGRARAADPVAPAEASAAGAAGGEVDRAVFDALLASIGRENGQELLDRLRDDIRAAAAGLGRARQSGDAGAARAQSHVLMSVAGVIGARRLQGIARRLNEAAHAEDVDKIRELSRDCLSALANLDDFIELERRRLVS